MKRYARLFALVLAGLTWVGGEGATQEAAPRDASRDVYQEEPPAPAEPGFKWVREVRYKQVQQPVCKLVPDKRYKWLYETRPDYYCIPACPLHFRCHKSDCDECQFCQNCKGPYYRPQLKKIQVEMDCGWKCIVEYVKAEVPCVVWRKVRIGAETEKGVAPEMPPAPTQVPAPPGGQYPEGEPGSPPRKSGETMPHR
jgi:hypothetical protein